MNREWRARSFDELLAELGEPQLLLDLSKGSSPGFIAIYGVDRATGCIDAFVVHADPDRTIGGYHCR